MSNQKYFKNQVGTIFYFDLSDENDVKYISNMEDILTELNPLEVDKIENPQKYLTKEEKYEQYLESLLPLTRRQFMLILIKYDLDEKIETTIESIKDVTQRKIVRTEFKESVTFERKSESIQYISKLLKLKDEELNKMWEEALLL